MKTKDYYDDMEEKDKKSDREWRSAGKFCGNCGTKRNVAQGLSCDSFCGVIDSAQESLWTPKSDSPASPEEVKESVELRLMGRVND